MREQIRSGRFGVDKRLGPAVIQVSDHAAAKEHQRQHFAELVGHIRRCMDFLFHISNFLFPYSTIKEEMSS